MSIKTRARLYAMTLALAACGGGGGGGDGGSTPPPPPPPPAAVTLSGTAVKGAALGGALIEASCATGSGSATAAGNGSFTISITGGALPCVLRAPLGDGTYLHSAISAGTAANISPITQLVVAQVAGVDPTKLFSDFKAGTPTASAPALTADKLTVAIDAVKATLVAAGIDLGTVNPLSAALAVGDAQDQKIDALVAKLADSGTTLTEFTQTVVAASPVNTAGGTPGTGTTSGVASLPADLLLKPAAANCAALRSGEYRVVFFQPQASGTGAPDTVATTKATIDATALTVTISPTDITTLIPIGTCRFTDADASEVVVSEAGVMSIRSKDDAGQFRQGIAFPEQAHTVAELQGVWNTLNWERDSDTATTFHAEAYTGTFDASGKLTALLGCTDVTTTCETATAATLPKVQLSVNAKGGFDFNNTTDGFVDRVFAYRAGGGELMLVDLSPGGSFSVWTRQRTNGLPDVGAISRNFDATISNTLLSAGPFSESGNTIKTTDAASGAFVRTTFGNLAGGATFATWDQSLRINNPRNGYTRRLGETGVPTSATGLTVTNREFVALGLRGMGMSAVWLPSNATNGTNNAQLLLSMSQPGSPWLPPALISKNYASNCTFLRSTTYRIVLFDANSTAAANTDKLTINAPALTVTNSQGGVDTLVPNGNCRYTTGSGGEAVVAPSGVIAIRDNSGHPRLAFPEQTHTLAELAGTWNKIGYSNNGSGAFVADAASATLDASGNTTAISFCPDVATCSAVTGKTITLAVNAGGGFDRTSSDGWTDRVFAFQAGNGDLMLVNVSGDGSFGFWTQQRTNALPTVGVRTRNWDVTISASLSTTVGESTNIVTAVDTAASSASRLRKTTSGASYTETLRINSPRAGYNTRPAATVTASDGSSINVREFTSLSMRGMGFSPLKYLAPTEQFFISVNRP